jgi:hypothetical protein
MRGSGHRVIFESMPTTLKRLSVAFACAVLAGASGCAPKAAGPVAAPTAAPTPTISQTCPDPTDGPSIVVNAVEEGHRALVANPSTALPPACVLTAFAHITRVLPDSLNDHALAIAAALRTRGTNPRELLASEIVVLGRMRRWADVSRTYERLLAVDPEPSIDVLRSAIVAARQRADTAGLVRVLTKASSAPGASPAIRAELNVVRQAKALVAAINEARGLVRQNPRYVAAYPSLVGNFGTLGMADSVVANIRRALAQNAPRASLASSVETLVSAMLRHASLYGSSYGWDAPIAAAIRVDSALTTPSTKFLVAALIVQSSEPRINEISALIGGTSWLPQPVETAATANRTAACQRIAPLSAALSVAERRMRDGGDRYPGGGVAQINAGLTAAKERLAGFEELCARK